MPKEKIEHINYAMVAKAHTPMYVVHKYWARKPHNVVAEYIKHYSKGGDIVLDPFVGSGVTALEALKSGRKAIGLDLNPMSIFITKLTGLTVNLDEIKKEFKRIENAIKDDILDLYKTFCPKCKKSSLIICTHVNKNKPIKIMYECEYCHKKGEKQISEEDIKLFKKIEKTDIKLWYPKDKFPEGETFNQGRREAGEYFSDLFTKRNLTALSILFNEINKIKDIDIRNIYKFAFTSIVHLASKMTPVRPTRQFSSFWAMPSYWVPPIYMESNVWFLFNSAVNGKQGIIKAKEDSNNQIKEFREAKSFSELKESKNIFLKVQNALEITKIIPSNSIDYIFTDPPYGGAVPYFELSSLWAKWLNFDISFTDEITINKFQKKDFDLYHRMLTASFRQMFEILKPNKFLTVTFHSKDIKVWTSIIKAIVIAGFDLEKVIYQPPARTSSAGLLRPYGSAVGDYYLRFRKPESESLKNLEDMDEERYKRIVLEAAKRIIAERGEPTPYTFILNGIIVELKKEGALLLGEKNPDDVMKEFLNKEFVLIDIKDEKNRVVGKKWWFKEPSKIPYLEAIPLSDRVETAIVEVLRRKVKVSFDDILQEIFIKFPNALTPETQDIKSLLEEYAKPTKDGNWQLKESVKSRESEHTKIIAYIAVLGKKAGYDVWIGSKEQGDIYEGEKLSKYVTNKNPVFRFIPSTNLDRVKQIDVIWHDEGRVKFEFEVENTTAITEAIVRGSNIPHDSIKRIIIIPEEREKLLHRKLEEPMIKENVEKEKWKFLFYKDIEDFFKYCKTKKKIETDYLEKKFRTPKPVRDKQNSINDFSK